MCTHSVVLASDAEAGRGPDELVEVRRGVEVADPDPEVVDVPALAERSVVDGFGAVAVRVEQEGAVVVVAVLRPQARLPVVLVPGLGPNAPERVDELARGGDEGDVQPARHGVLLVGLAECEVVPLHEVLVPVGLADPDRLQDEVVEPL